MNDIRARRSEQLEQASQRAGELMQAMLEEDQPEWLSKHCRAYHRLTDGLPIHFLACVSDHLDGLLQTTLLDWAADGLAGELTLPWVEALEECYELSIRFPAKAPRERDRMLACQNLGRIRNVEDYRNQQAHLMLLWKVLPRVKEEALRLQKLASPELQEELPPPISPEPKQRVASGVLVDGMDNCLIKFSRCCNPLPGDEIIGFITRGFGVSIHKRSCNNVPRDLTQCPEPERWVNAHWAGDVKDDFKSTLHIVAVDRGGLLADVTQQLSNMKIFIHALNSRQERGSNNAFISATISINGLPQLQNIIERLSKIPGVLSIDRS